MPKGRKGLLKRFMPQTLLGRSLLILITPVFLIQIIATFIFFDRHWNKMTSRLAFSVAGEIALMATVMNDETGGVNSEQSLRLMNVAEQNLGVHFEFEPQKTISKEEHSYSLFEDTWARMIRKTLSRELSGTLEQEFFIDVDPSEKMIQILVQLDDGALIVTLPQRRLFSSTSYIFLLWVFCASTILLIIAVLFMRNQIRPIRRLAIAAERFGKGQDVRHFKVEGAKEVRQAGQAFVDMKERIQRQINQRTDMLAGVSHDLRTPLTRLKLQLAMFGESQDAQDMKEDISEMEKMIDGYLSFVRGEGREPSTITDLNILIEEVVNTAKRQGVDVHIDMDDVPVKIFLKPLAFKRCISNIINNAAKYAENVWVSLYREDDIVRIRIEDNGPGIDESLYEEVFRPFYRVDSSRNSETGGVGLGLPIALDIVNAHGGHIGLQKSQHGGLAVLIELPA